MDFASFEVLPLSYFKLENGNVIVVKEWETFFMGLVENELMVLFVCYCQRNIIVMVRF